MSHLQGTVMFRARLPFSNSPSLPRDESHLFMGDGQIGLYYPISQKHCVWTVGVPETLLADAGVPAKPAKTSTVEANGNTESLRIEAGKITLQVLQQHKS